MLVNLLSLAISLTALIVSYFAMAYTARPKVTVRLLSARERVAGEVAELRFRVSIKSWIRRSAGDLHIYANFLPNLVPISAHFGSTLEKADSTVRVGKGGAKYVAIKGIVLSKREPISYEDFVVKVQIPDIAGRYEGWTTAFAYGWADECGVARFTLIASKAVLEPETTNERS